MKDKELIKQEIERRIDLYSIAEKDDLTFARMGELSSLIDFINSLSEEPASKDLEEEIDEEIDNLCELGYYMEDLAKGNSEGIYPLPDNVVKELRKFASHFAEWQEKKMLGITEAFYQQGRHEQEQEMMKDAVEGEYWIGEIHLDTPIIQGYDDGDRIKFIPIKYEQQ